MKTALLILLMMLLPWQASAAAERNLAHVVGSGGAHGLELVGKHMAEHAAHVLHHHHDDDDDDEAGVGTHEDSAEKSIQHLADFEQSCGMNILLPAAPHLPRLFVSRVPPVFRADTFSNRTTIPLLRPPRTLA